MFKTILKEVSCISKQGVWGETPNRAEGDTGALAKQIDGAKRPLYNYLFFLYLFSIPVTFCPFLDNFFHSQGNFCPFLNTFFPI